MPVSAKNKRREFCDDLREMAGASAATFVALGEDPTGLS